MQITLFFLPLKVLTSPLTHVLEGQGPVRRRQDVWWSVYVPCTYDEVMRNPAVATVNGEEISPVYGGIGKQSRHKLTVTKPACMCLRNLHWCTNSGCTQCILTHKHAHAHTHTHIHTQTHTHTHIRGDRSPRAEDILLVALALLVLIRIPGVKGRGRA